jgi:hypothetical protein
MQPFSSAGSSIGANDSDEASDTLFLFAQRPKGGPLSRATVQSRRQNTRTEAEAAHERNVITDNFN